jgi:hypothetical protein
LKVARLSTHPESFVLISSQVQLKVFPALKASKASNAVDDERLFRAIFAMLAKDLLR